MDTLVKAFLLSDNNSNLTAMNNLSSFLTQRFNEPQHKISFNVGDIIEIENSPNLNNRAYTIARRNHIFETQNRIYVLSLYLQVVNQ